MPVLLCAAELFAAPQTLPLGGVNITACVRGSVVDIDRNGDRRTDGGAIDKIVVAGNDLALFVAQDGREKHLVLIEAVWSALKFKLCRKQTHTVGAIRLDDIEDVVRRRFRSSVKRDATGLDGFELDAGRCCSVSRLVSKVDGLTRLDIAVGFLISEN